MTDELSKLKRRVERAKLARQEAEDLLEKKSRELYDKNMELKNLSNGLEKLIAQRTALMQKARDEALLALQIKSDFIANMSHELRTPLNGVLGILGLLEDGTLNAEQSELLSIAKASGEHLLMVINDVLDFSKIEADKIDLTEMPLELGSYFKTVCKPFELQASQKGIEFGLKVDKQIKGSVLADKLRLTQIISNLLSNAIKFTHEGSVEMSVDKVGDKTYHIAVRDTGIGMGQASLENIFNAFEQADTTITRNFGGTGLGMTITKKLVDLMQGTVSVSSQIGEGSCFEVMLDLLPHAEQDVTDVDIYESPPFEENKTSLRKNLNILLVEDNRINQLVAKRVLESWDMSVEIAENGQRAVDILQNKSFDIIFMDLQMPVMDGIEATREIRANDLIKPDCPIVAMTAHSTDEHIKHCKDAGMQGHISKPIDKELLRSTIEDLVSDVVLESEGAQSDNGSLEIPGVDVNDALNRLNGDSALMLTLLMNFVEDHVEVKELLDLAELDGDTEQMDAILHRMKGSGSNLGLKDLAKLAEEGQIVLKENGKLNETDKISMQSQIDDLRTHLKMIHTSSESLDEGIKLPFSHSEFIELVDIVITNVHRDVNSAELAIRKLQQYDTSVDIQEHLKTSMALMERFDMKQLEHSMMALKEKMRN